MHDVHVSLNQQLADALGFFELDQYWFETSSSLPQPDGLARRSCREASLSLVRRPVSSRSLISRKHITWPYRIWSWRCVIHINLRTGSTTRKRQWRSCPFSRKRMRPTSGLPAASGGPQWKGFNKCLSRPVRLDPRLLPPLKPMTFMSRPRRVSKAVRGTKSLKMCHSATQRHLTNALSFYATLHLTRKRLRISHCRAAKDRGGERPGSFSHVAWT